MFDYNPSKALEHAIDYAKTIIALCEDCQLKDTTDAKLHAIKDTILALSNLLPENEVLQNYCDRIAE